MITAFMWVTSALETHGRAVPGGGKRLDGAAAGRIAAGLVWLESLGGVRGPDVDARAWPTWPHEIMADPVRWATDDVPCGRVDGIRTALCAGSRRPFTRFDGSDAPVGRVDRGFAHRSPV